MKHLLVFDLLLLFCCVSSQPERVEWTYVAYGSDDQKIILKLHNDYRNKVAGSGIKVSDGTIGSAANMEVLHWSKELANAAKKGVSKHEQDHTFPSTDGKIKCNYGQNLEWTEQLPCDASAADLYKASVKAWTDESENFTVNALDPYVADKDGDPTYGHFAQIVWAKTYLVGCAHAKIKKSDYCRHLIRCNYYTAGLATDHWSMYIPGDPLANCTTKSKSKKYSNLCDDDPKTIPQTETDPDGTTWTPMTRNCDGTWSR